MNPVVGEAADRTLARTGWARSVGGANPYITLFSRSGIGRADVDSAVERVEIHELPSARGCTYVVPREDYAIALKSGQGFGEAAAISTATKYLGVTEGELRRLEEAVLEKLEKGALDPKDLRALLGDTVRNLGDEGKKRGQTTTLPLALGRLQAEGKIRRIPTSGRLDQQRYRYALWSPSPLDSTSLTREEAHRELASRYFRWAGPATPAHFQWFSGLGVKVAKAAMAELDLVPIEDGSEYLIHRSDLEEFRSFTVPSDPVYSLIQGIDGLLLLRRDLANFIDPADRERTVFTDKGPKPVHALQDLESHGIFDRGRLVGLWEFDPEASKIAWVSFVEKNGDLPRAVETMEVFVREQLGDMRSFSLDSPESRRTRIEALR